MAGDDWSDADLDFLSDPQVPDRRQGAAAQLEAARAELLDWAAAALVSRHPELTPYRGKRGLRAARLDLDLQLKHVHAALSGGPPADSTAFARWLETSLAQRGLDGRAIDASVTILAEALWRYLPADAGGEALARLVASFPAAKVAYRPACG